MLEVKRYRKGHAVFFHGKRVSKPFTYREDARSFKRQLENTLS